MDASGLSRGQDPHGPSQSRPSARLPLIPTRFPSGPVSDWLLRSASPRCPRLTAVRQRAGRCRQRETWK
ncbi:hypothetical protein AOLI_G00330410 [Acnodon oligacanthus]